MTRSSSSHPAAEANQLINYISAETLDIVELLKNAHHPGAGAVVLFSGEVRDNNRGRDVAYLEYESYGPLASGMIEYILQEANEKGKLRIAIDHHSVIHVALC